MTVISCDLNHILSEIDKIWFQAVVDKIWFQELGHTDLADQHREEMKSHILPWLLKFLVNSL
jgi:hypothetical protein